MAGVSGETVIENNSAGVIEMKWVVRWILPQYKNFTEY